MSQPCWPHRGTALVDGDMPADPHAARGWLYDAFARRLGELAGRALLRGLPRAQVDVVCIDVDDPVWRRLVDELMPGHDWQAIRDRGERPVAFGSTVGVRELVAMLCPSVAAAAREHVPAGRVRCFVMAGGGVTVRPIEPLQEGS